MKKSALVFFFICTIALLWSCKKKADDPDLTTEYLGTYSYSYSRDNGEGATSRSGTMVISKSSNSSVTIPFSDGKNRTFTISGDKLTQKPQSVLLGEVENGIYKEYTFNEESTGSLSGKTLRISGTASRPDTKGYSFSVRADRK